MPRKREKQKKNKKDEENSEKIEDNQKDRHESQLKWILIVMGIIVIVAIGIYLIIDSLKKFEYGGMHFEEIMFDKLKLYHSKVALNDGTQLVIYNLFLRNDPRKLKNIPVEEKIALDRNVIISVDPSINNECEDNGIAGANLGNLLNAAGLRVSFGYSDENYAKEKNASYITCKDKYKGTILMIRKSDENSIKKEGEYCYSISYKDCDILKVIERFEVAVIANARGEEV